MTEFKARSEFTYTIFPILILAGKIAFTFFEDKSIHSDMVKFSLNQTISLESVCIPRKSCFSDGFDITFYRLDVLLPVTFVYNFNLFVEGIVRNRVMRRARKVVIDT